MKNFRSDKRTKTHKPGFKMNSKNLSNIPISKDSNLNPQNSSPSKKLSHAPQEPTNMELKSSSSEKRLSSNLNTYVPENKERKMKKLMKMTMMKIVMIIKIRKKKKKKTKKEKKKKEKIKI